MKHVLPRWPLAGFLLVLVAACGGGSSRTLKIDVIGDGPYAGVSLAITVNGSITKVFPNAHFDQSATLAVGIFLPNSAAGTIAIEGTAMDARGCVIGSGANALSDVKAGQALPNAVPLMINHVDGPCGDAGVDGPGTGGAGVGGASGTGGTRGTGGAGTGGADGTGGARGTGGAGTGGANGTGGAQGIGGASGGAGGGTAGRGGRAGGAGTGGAGTGGAGTGGAGTGGAGTGGAGTGGAPTPVCGNGIVEGAEACDDGGTASNDGCDGSCKVEPGFTCTGTRPTRCSLDPQCLVRFYRLYSSGTGDHFHTTDVAELNNAVGNLGYVVEDIPVYVAKTQIPGTSPFYRFYAGAASDHFHTTDPGEAATVGYTSEGIRAYVATTARPGSVPFYRIYHSSGYTDRFHTTSADELAAAVPGFGYVNEGIRAYVWTALPPGWSVCP